MRLHRTVISGRAYALLAGLLLLAPAVARADGDDVEGVGEAAVNNDDVVQAKERATTAALRDAVEKKLGTYIASDSQTKDFSLVKDQILTTAQGYVSSYDVVDAKRDGDTFTVRIRAKVAAQKIEADAAARGLAIRAMKFPRMAVIIAEQHLGQTSPQWWGDGKTGGSPGGQTVAIDQRVVENELIGDWTSAGFSFVDMEALSGKLRTANVLTTNPGQDAARTIGNLSDADVIIMGTAIATKQGDLGKILGDPNSQMTSCKGSISVRVFNSDSGEILTTADVSKTSLHIDPIVCDRRALIAATKQLATDLQAKVLEAWNKRLMGGSRVRMSVTGVKSYTQLSDFVSLLKETVRGVQGVEKKGFSDGKADLDVRLDGGDTEALAGDLDAKPLGKYKVRVVSLTANTIAVEIGK